ncbi:hypothetical protein [Amycolatopsis sp. NPDC052450]|uniref:hypothetical protein n=1 Tax=Amycolatopsis sp. NPDC052450 TaxID=3363937 RepID=UPI0037C54096
MCVAAAQQHGEAVQRPLYEAIGCGSISRARLGRGLILAAPHAVALPITARRCAPATTRDGSDRRRRGHPGHPRSRPRR